MVIVGFLLLRFVHIIKYKLKWSHVQRFNIILQYSLLTTGLVAVVEKQTDKSTRFAKELYLIIDYWKMKI